MPRERLTLIAAAALLLIGRAGLAQSYTYTIVDTGQAVAYDNEVGISPPAAGEDFFGQDAHYNGAQPSYEDNGDGTVTDLNTGLMWQKTPEFNNKLTFAEAGEYAESLELASYDDWRLPTIKELYSLIDFRGGSRRTADASTPYIDTDYFDFEYPDASTGDRLIDAQYWSSTAYVGTTFGGNATAFGVNFADGRIKGYPTETGRGGRPKTSYVRCVRGNPDYGVNDFVDNEDGTVTDRATGLMWMQADSGEAMNWQEALAYAEALESAGHDDWRLPNAKELQSIIDYTHAPDATDQAARGPAIDTEFFELTAVESWFWSGTTLRESPPDQGVGSQAVYFAVGQAYGVFDDRGGGTKLVNVHGAGAQRGDPKSGDPADYANGRGPQNDQIRINNYVRVVRNVSADDVQIVTPAEPDSSEMQQSGQGGDGRGGAEGPPSQDSDDDNSNRHPPQDADGGRRRPPRPSRPPRHPPGR